MRTRTSVKTSAHGSSVLPDPTWPVPPTFEGERLVGPERKIYDCILVIFDLFVIAGFEPYLTTKTGTKLYNIQPTIDHWILCYRSFIKKDPRNWVKLVKYKLNSYFAVWNHQVPPVCPFTRSDKPSQILGGRAGQWVKLLFRTDKTTFYSLVSSILYSKNGMPKPDEPEILQLEIEETIKTLTTEPETQPMGFIPIHTPADLPFPDLSDFILRQDEYPSEKYIKYSQLNIDSYWVCDRTLEGEIRRTVRELFESEVYTVEDDQRVYFPATKANAFAGIGEGGTAGFLSNAVAAPLKEWADSSKAAEIVAMIKNPKWLEGVEHQSLLRWNLQTLNGTLPDPREMTFAERRELLNSGAADELVQERLQELLEEISIDSSVLGMALTYEKLQLRWNQFQAENLALSQQIKNVAIPIALPEALKVRIITKGSPYLTMRLKPLQKFLHSVLRRHPVFQLIGTPITDEIINRTISILHTGEKWNSGDYKAATNNFRLCLSFWCIDELCDVLKLPEELTMAFHMALSEHYFEDPENYQSYMGGPTNFHGEIPPSPDPEVRRKAFQGLLDRFLLKQRNGQLMGSIVSFPILCIVNAAICRWAMEVGVGRPLTLRGLRLLINGDDNCFPTTLAGYNAWRYIATFAGLTPSEGKSYFSDEFLTLNSQEFRPIPHDSQLNFLYQDVICDRVTAVKHVNMGLVEGTSRIHRAKGETTINLGNVGTFHRTLFDQCPSEWWPRANRMFLSKQSVLLHSCPKSVPWYFPEWIGGLGLLPSSPDQRSLKDRRIAKTLLMNWAKVKPLGYMPEVSWHVHQNVLKALPFLEEKWELKSNYLLLRNPLESDVIEQAWSEAESNYHQAYVLTAVAMYLDGVQLFSQSPKSKAKSLTDFNGRLWEFGRDFCCGGEGLSDYELSPYRELSSYAIVINKPVSLQGPLRSNLQSIYSRVCQTLP